MNDAYLMWVNFMTVNRSARISHANDCSIRGLVTALEAGTIAGQGGGCEAWHSQHCQNTTLQLSASSSPLQPQSAVIDPLMLLKLFFVACLRWWPHFVLFSSSLLSGGCGHLTISWAVLWDIDFTVPCFIGICKNRYLEIKISYDYCLCFLFSAFKNFELL